MVKLDYQTERGVNIYGEKMKNFVKLLALLLVAFPVLAGCSSKGEEIVYWTALTGPDGDYMTALVDEFNAQNEGVYYVEHSIIPNEDLVTKLTVAKGNTKNLPDVVLLDNVQIPRMADAGILTPIDDIISSLGLEETSYIPGAWDAAEYEGSMYGLPFDSYMFFLYYNKDILAELGYSEEDVWDITNEEAIAMAQESIDAGYNGWAMFQDWPWPEIYYGYLAAENGTVVAEDGKTLTFNDEAGLAAFEGFYAPYEAGVTNDPSIDGVVEFQQGNTLFKYDGIWQTTNFTGSEMQETGVNIGVAPLPRISEDSDNNLFTGSHNIVKVDKEYNEEQSAGMEAFIKFLNDNAGEFAEAGQVPANMDTWESETFKSMPFYAAATENAEHFVYAPKTIYWGTVAGEIQKSITGRINGTYESFEEALDQAEKDAAEQIENFESGETEEEEAEE